MRNSFPILILAALILFLGCKPKDKKGGGKEQAMPEALVAAYKIDAKYLALREVITSTTNQDLEAEIPQARIDHYYGLLAKVYQVFQRVDSIPDLSGIHVFPAISLRKVQVVLQPDADMIENWSKGITTTSDLYLNQLLSRYGCRVKDFKNTAAGPTVTIEASRDISTPALAESLKHNKQIKFAEEERMMGDGNNIEFGAEGKNQYALRYSIGAGDCPSGCIQRKFWIFYVSEAGEITYMGTRGNIPADMEPK